MIQIHELSYAYPQHGRGIGPFDFSVKPGEMLHMTGSSGCGKSTLARCITGLIPHIYHGTMKGSVRIGEHDTAGTPLWKLAESAGFVFQNPAMQMLGNSVEEEILMGLENLGLGRGEMRDRLDEALERFGLGSFRGRAPQTLSGGEQQKLALAAIIARRPPVLILDEPLSMLDVAAATEFAGYLSELARAGTAIVIFEHRSDYLAGLPGIRIAALDSATVPERSGAPGRWARAASDEKRGPKLDVSGLAVTIGGKPVIRDLSFSIEPGQVIAVVGRNGSGKTTLVRALAGLQKHGGSIDIGGMRPDFGQVYQNADLQLFNASVRSEILYRVKDPDMAWYAWLMETLCLRQYEDTPPLILSEGEKKRVALATVLMRKAAHGILLDEPSLGQDMAHKKMLIDICRGLAARGKIVLFTTHELHLAAMADRVILLGQDGIAADGPPEQVFRNAAAWKRAGLFVPPWLTETGQKVITA
ncbi:MAG TPA: ATP-binding cassette domain-containing protein [Spirochaetota bacterium]|nr:ATP-binding cassette domain-containing protein [Spirochaetota bacterium]HPV41356.1 ATP-binding cassette domain-containing protein [Spirochaetota bacterium]